jgi:hypothetical protein
MRSLFGWGTKMPGDASCCPAVLLRRLSVDAILQEPSDDRIMVLFGRSHERRAALKRFLVDVGAELLDEAF